jgi:hypothetical protein
MRIRDMLKLFVQSIIIAGAAWWIMVFFLALSNGV